MPVPSLPQTVARLSTSVTIRLIPNDTLNAAALANPATLITAMQSTPIGAVESFAETNTRPAAIRFQMDASNPGVVQEVYPNQVEARTITLTRVVLYSGDAMDVFNITGGDVVQQFAPFALIKVEVVPSNLTSTLNTQITVYRGCWFTTNPKKYDVTKELKIVQDVNITYAERDVLSL